MLAYLKSLFRPEIPIAPDQPQPLWGSMDAKLLNDLTRYEKIGVSHVILRSSHDERDTKVERELDGVKMPIAEARRLLTYRFGDIPRSTFEAVISFD